MKRLFLMILLVLLWAMPANAMICLDNTDTLEGGASVTNVVDYTVFGLNVSTFANLAQGQLSDTDPSVLYTATAGTSIVSVVLVNTHTSAVTVNLYLDPANAGTPRRLIPKDLSLGAGYSMVFDGQRCTVLDDDGGLLGSYSGVLPIARGGTGQTTASAAFDALSPMTTIGDLIYGGASGTGTRLAAGTANYLFQANGAAAPSWTNTPNIGAATGTSLDLSGDLDAGTLTAGSGSIVDSSGAISFGDENLSTTGTFTAANLYIGQYLYHTGDADTYFNFTPDSLVGSVGGEAWLTVTEDDSQDIVKIGDGGDIDINLNDDVFVEGSTGNVGIGTASPTNKLSIDAGRNEKVLTVYMTGSDGDYSEIGFQYSAALPAYGRSGIRNYISSGGAEGNLAFLVNDAGTTLTERMRIVGRTGNVGIGTTSPGYELEVTGNIYASGDVSALTFTDRTPFYEGDALAAIKLIKGLDGHIDHASLPEFAQRPIQQFDKETILGPQVPVAAADAWETITEPQTVQVKDASDKPIIEKVETIYSIDGEKVVRETKPIYQTESVLVSRKQLKEGVKLDPKTGTFYTQTSTVAKTVIAETPGRDLGAMISILTKAVQQLTARIEVLENPVVVKPK